MPTSSAFPSTSPPSPSSPRRNRRARRFRSRPCARNATPSKSASRGSKATASNCPQERLTAHFNDDSILELTPDLVGPSITHNSGIIGEGVDLNLEHLGDMRPSTLLFHVTKHLLYTKWRDPGEEPKLHLFGQLKTHYQAVARSLPRLQGRHLSRAAHVSRTGRHGLQPHHRGNHPSVPRRAAHQGPARPVQPDRLDQVMSDSIPRRRSAGKPARVAAKSTGSSSTATGRANSAASRSRTPRSART